MTPDSAQDPAHTARIHQQFSRQAVPFSDAPSMRDAQAIGALVDAVQPERHHRTLDVACGPGLLAIAFAARVAHATGLDTTQAMLDRARELQAASSLSNLQWDPGDAYALPYDDGKFDIVTTRFSWHHLQAPHRAMREMLRVCRPGGRLLVCDGVASDEAAKAEAFNAMERIRDPSTVRFLTESELVGIVASGDGALGPVRRYRVPAELEGLMRASFPDPGGAERVRRMIEASASDDALGMGTRIVDGRVVFHYPAVYVTLTRR